MIDPTHEQRRRREPSMAETDWLVLKGLRTAIADMARRVARPGAVALDFGCGARPYEPIFRQAGIRYVGADLGDAAEVAIDARGILAADAASADLVLSFQVLEHVRDLGTYLGEARRVLRPDGRLMLSTHGTWLYHPHPEDHRRWTRPGLIAEMASHGFEVIECVPVVGPLALTTIVRLTCACFGLRRIPLVGRLLGKALAVAMNLRARIEDAVTPAWVTQDNACVYVTLSRPAAAP